MCVLSLRCFLNHFLIFRPSLSASDRIYVSEPLSWSRISSNFETPIVPRVQLICTATINASSILRLSVLSSTMRTLSERYIFITLGIVFSRQLQTVSRVHQFMHPPFHRMRLHP